MAVKIPVRFRKLVPEAIVPTYATRAMPGRIFTPWRTHGWLRIRPLP